MHEHELSKDCPCGPEVLVVEGREYPFVITIEASEEN